ncbi:MAG: citrate/2-methylcitrate synthase [Candidatus Ranarchaeia archaeon]
MQKKKLDTKKKDSKKSLKSTGLRGVSITDTKISLVDGEKGELIIRGYSISELAKFATFEETSYLLINGRLPTLDELNIFKKKLKKYRLLPIAVTRFLYECTELPPMGILQAAVPLLATGDEDATKETIEAHKESSIKIIARLPVLLAEWHRIRSCKRIIESDMELDHAANFLYQLTGKRPTKEDAKAFDSLLILHIDHGLTPSTFASRAVASSRTSMYTAISAGIGSLSGYWHGGANERVMEMLLEIKSPENVIDYIKGKLDKNERIMGFGHAVYRVLDPRARILRERLHEVSARKGDLKWFEISERVATITRLELEKRKGEIGSRLWPNVDFFAAPLMYMLNIPKDLFTGVFSVSRVVGWLAHIIEELHAQAQNKPMIYRPKATYIGKYEGPGLRLFIPVEQRDADWPKRALEESHKTEKKRKLTIG